MELQQFSSQFLRHNQTQMKLRCAQLLVDWQQQCSFVIQVNVSFASLFDRLILFRMFHSLVCYVRKV